MSDINEALAAEQQRLASMVDPLDGAMLALPSRCDGWSIADVLLHVAQTNEFAVASTRGELEESVESGPQVGAVGDVDQWAAEVVAAERTDDLDAIRDRWKASADAQLRAFEECDPGVRVQWVAGELAARTLATTRLSETWIHSGDVAFGLGIDLQPTDRLWHIARLAHRILPYAFLRAERPMVGTVAFHLRSPAGDQWSFGDDDAATVITGATIELCEVAAQRRDAADSSLRGDGPDAAAVLELVRTFA